VSDPEQLRREAAEADALAKVVSYAADKERLRARAVELRRRADEAEAEHVRRRR
jgi:hypothetical protein